VKVVARHADYILPLLSIDCGLGRRLPGASRLHLDETKNLPFPTDEIDLAVP
jgi:hypothetical protein